MVNNDLSNTGLAPAPPVNEGTNATPSVAQDSPPAAPPLAITQGENNMADVDTSVLSNGHTILASEINAATGSIKQGQTTLANGQTVLANEIAAVRHDVGLAEANVRDSIGQHSGLINKNIGDNGFRIAASEAALQKGIGDNRFSIAAEAAGLSKQIGAEACAINKHIGDMRQEDAENFGHTRRDIASKAHELSTQIGDGFCATDSKILTTGSDIRREGAEHTNEIVKEGLKGDYNTQTAIKDARFELATRVEAQGDRVVDRLGEHDMKVADRFFTVGRDLMDLRQGQATLAKDVELNALKTQLDAKENTKYLSDKIVADGEKTRGLINDLKYHDLNRGLVERQTELVNCEQDRRWLRDRYEDGRWSQVQAQFAGQWAQLQSQIQAFQSQLQETRQGLVNFGTMAGNAGQQSSTSNNVR